MVELRKTIYFHIGTYKTGTTSFQHFVRDHRHVLEEHGMLSHIEKGPDNTEEANSVIFAHHFLRPSLLSFARLLGLAKVYSIFEFAGYFSRLVGSIRSAPYPNYLISAESLCFFRTKSEQLKLLAFKHVLRAKVVVIVVFRNERDWRASWKDQCLKNPTIRMRAEAGDLTILDDWYFDRSAIISFWSKLGEVRIINYDDAVQKYGDIIVPLLKSMQLNFRPERDYRINQREQLKSR